MKTLLLGLFVFLTACNSNEQNTDNIPVDGVRPRGAFLVDIRFVDEAGNDLLNRIQLRETPSGDCYLDSLQYSLQGWINGKYITPEPLLKWLPVYPKSGVISFQYNFWNSGNSSSDSKWIYTLKFTYSELLGDNLEHTLVIEKKEKNGGYHNNFERLLFDGKVIATDMEGDATDIHRAPFVIVVPQK